MKNISACHPPSFVSFPFKKKKKKKKFLSNQPTYPISFISAPSDEFDRYLVFDRNGLYCYRQVANTLASVASM